MVNGTQGIPLARRLLARPTARQLAGLGAVLLCCLCLFFWAGHTFLPDATQLYRREIVNDDYLDADGALVLTQPLAAGGEVRQSLFAQGRLYGLRLCVATFGRVPHGTLHLRLLDAQGVQVAACDTDMTTLLDNTFHLFLFDDMVDAEDGAAYTLVITASPETPQDTLAFYRSSGPAQSFVAEGADAPHYPLDDFTLLQNGQAVNSTLALQYITHYAGGFIVGAYAFFAALLTVFLLALFWLVFVAKTPIHRLFVVCALGLGFVFLFLIPPRTAPDEYTHISNVYRITNQFFGMQHSSGGWLFMRPGDAMKLDNYDFGATDIFAWQQMAEGLFAKMPAGEMTEQLAQYGSFWPPLYAAPTAGVLLARLLGLGQVPLLLLGRLANLLFYTIVVSRAIKRMPLARPMLFTVGLLPMCLQLAASFSYDCYVIAVGLYFTALCLDYALGSRKLGPKQIAGLVVLAVLLAPAKTVYVLLVLLVLFIPAANFSGQKAARTAKLVVLAAAVAIWLPYNAGWVQNAAGADFAAPPGASAPLVVEPAAAAPGPAEGLHLTTDGAEENTLLLTPAAQPDETPPELLPNGDAAQMFTFGYILRHIPQTLKLLANTFWTQGPLWLQGLIGGRLGEVIAIHLEVNWLFVIGLLGILLCNTLPTAANTLLLAPRRRWASLGIALGVAALFVLACLTWTPINYTTIFGIQGRYLLPVLPLLLLALRGGNLRFGKPPWRALAFAQAVLVVLCQLDAFILILQRG